MRVIDLINTASEHMKQKSFENYRLEVERMLGSVLGLSRIELYVEFERLLTDALGPLDDLQMRYVHLAGEAFDAVHEDGAAAAFLLKPPQIDQVETIAGLRVMALSQSAKALSRSLIPKCAEALLLYASAKSGLSAMALSQSAIALSNLPLPQYAAPRLLYASARRGFFRIARVHSAMARS